MIVLGLGSGTSVDGIDSAAVEFELRGSTLRARVVAARQDPYPAAVRDAILSLLPPSKVGVEQVCRVDTTVGQAFAEAAGRLLAQIGGPAGLIASHGQTVFHDVVGGRVQGTLQLGQPAWIAERTGLPVLSDLRAADVAAGGHGAPLASTWDALWLSGRQEPVAALNLGGIANVSVVRPDGQISAFDTGPANALIDAAVRWRTAGREHVDTDGSLAARGRTDIGLLRVLLAEPYYDAAAPKTTGKELFHLPYLQAAVSRLDHQVSTPDLLATLVELTATTVARAVRDCGVGQVVASGGGTLNPTLMSRLAVALAPVRLTTSEQLGLDPDLKEACLFALLGWLSWHGLPGTALQATGARSARVAGRWTSGHDPLRLPQPLSAWPSRLEVVTDSGVR